MSTIEAKKEALKQLMGIVKQLHLETMKGNSPNESPEHEAKESEDIENLEKQTGIEQASGGVSQRPLPEVTETPKPVEGEDDKPVEWEQVEEPETMIAAEGSRGRPIPKPQSPEEIEREKRVRNMYNGGNSRSMLAGVGSAPSKSKRG